MASIYNSARNSTAGVFDFIGSVANVGNQLVNTAAKSVDMLDAKADLMHKRVVTNARAQAVNVVDEEIIKAATAHTDLMEETHKANFPDEPFDRKAFYLEAIRKITEAVNNP